MMVFLFRHDFAVIFGSRTRPSLLQREKSPATFSFFFRPQVLRVFFATSTLLMDSMQPCSLHHEFREEQFFFSNEHNSCSKTNARQGTDLSK